MAALSTMEPSLEPLRTRSGLMNCSQLPLKAKIKWRLYWKTRKSTYLNSASAVKPKNGSKLWKSLWLLWWHQLCQSLNIWLNKNEKHHQVLHDAHEDRWMSTCTSNMLLAILILIYDLTVALILPKDVRILNFLEILSSLVFI